MSDQKIPLLVIAGPTASGKTALAAELAIRLNGEVVSADSMQIYRRMNIGTAKPTAEETRGVPHHLIDFLEPGESFSVARYVELAAAAIRDIHSRGKTPVLAGGTGLYLDSLTRNIQFPDMSEDPALREALRAEAERGGPEAVWRKLQACDPALAETLHPANLGRVIRAIEVTTATGVPMSEWQRRSRLADSPYNSVHIGLGFRSRETLYGRIDRRVGLMLERGLLAEARALFDEGLAGTAGQAIGYKELFAFLKGEATLEEAAAKLRQSTRRYAKRQITWLRRDGRIRWLYPDDYGDLNALADAAEEFAATIL